MLFCHLSNAASCRDISNGLMSIAGNINHLGCKQAPSKSSVSYINKHRDHRLFEKFFYEVIDHLGQHVGFQKKKRQGAWLYLIEDTWITNGFTIWTAEISISLQGPRTTWITRSRKLMKQTLNQGLFKMTTSNSSDKNLARTTLTHLEE